MKSFIPKIEIIKTLIFILLVAILFKCNGQKEPKRIYNDAKFYTSINIDNNYYEYIFCLKFGIHDSCEYLIPEFIQLYMPEDSSFQGDTVKINNIGNLDEIYSSYPTKKFLAFSIYLNQKKFITKRLYDQMLALCLYADSTDIIANYELSKLRYTGGYVGQADFLIDNLSRYLPESVEIKRLKSDYKKQFGNNTYDQDMTYDDFFRFDTQYLNDYFKSFVPVKK